MSSVFCHQKPLTSFTDNSAKKDPEIGDVLFVFVYNTLEGNQCCNAMLLQAKISKLKEFTIGTEDDHQLQLYARWPTFEYKRYIGLNGHERNIQPKSATSGAQYLLIDNDPETGLAGHPGTFPFGSATAQSNIVLKKDFAEELVDFLSFKTGRTFNQSTYEPLKDGWSAMISDLLKMADIVSQRKNAGLIGDKRFKRVVTNTYDGHNFINSDESPSFLSDLIPSIR